MNAEKLVKPNYPTDRKKLPNGVIDVLPSNKNYEEDEFFQYYDKEYADYYDDLGIPEARMKAVDAFSMLKEVEIGDVKSVLDIGCGPGVVLDEFGKLCKAKATVGTDISSFILDVASKETRGHLFVRADSHQLPFADKAFDCALMIDVIEHIPGVEQILKETKRVSKMLILKVPLEKCLFYWVQSKVMKVDWKKTRGHINLYTKNSILEEMKKQGFQLIRWKVPRGKYPKGAFNSGFLFGCYQIFAWLAGFLPGPLYRALAITELSAVFTCD